MLASCLGVSDVVSSSGREEGGEHDAGRASGRDRSCHGPRLGEKPTGEQAYPLGGE